jgi:hypothetical protein
VYGKTGSEIKVTIDYLKRKGVETKGFDSTSETSLHSYDTPQVEVLYFAIDGCERGNCLLN